MRDQSVGNYYCNGERWFLRESNKNTFDWKSSVYFKTPTGNYSSPLIWAFIPQNMKVNKLSVYLEGFRDKGNDVCFLYWHPAGPPWTVTGTTEIVCTSVANDEQEPFEWSINNDAFVPAGSWIGCNTTYFNNKDPKGGVFHCKAELEPYTNQELVTRTLRFPPVDQFAPASPNSSEITKIPTVKYKSHKNFPIEVDSYYVFGGLHYVKLISACLYWHQANGQLVDKDCLTHAKSEDGSTGKGSPGEVKKISPRWRLNQGDYLSAGCTFFRALETEILPSFTACCSSGISRDLRATVIKL